jgi:hypothetical protein
MASRNLADLLPVVHEAANLALRELEEAGIKTVTSCTYRSKEEQEAFYYQGRFPLLDVNYVRKIAGLPTISEEENKKIITWTRGSENAPHCRRIALDVYPIEGGKLAQASSPLWIKVRKAFERHGFTSGVMVTNQKTKEKDLTDFPHQQYAGKL